jgi:hypothetical protein
LQAQALKMVEVIEKLKERVTLLPFGDPFFKDSRYRAEKLDAKNFHPIPHKVKNVTLCFVDGGSLKVAAAPNFAVKLHRLYFNLYRNNQRQRPKNMPQRIHFYTICYATSESKGIFYKVEFVPIKDEWISFLPNTSNLRFYSFDRTLMSGLRRASVSRVAEAVRAFTEWVFASHVIEQELSSGDIITRDGALQTFVTNESNYANMAYDSAMKKGIIFTGLAKTTTMFTSTGYPLLAAIKELAEASPYYNTSWYYHPIAKVDHPGHRAEMFVVCFDPRSDYVFRFEILKDQAEKMTKAEIGELIATLASNTRDAAFYGYPYGLVDAERFARGSGEEKDGQEILFEVSASQRNLWEKLSRFIRTTDAHSMLNKILGE